MRGKNRRSGGKPPHAKVAAFFAAQKHPLFIGAEVFDIFTDPTGQVVAQAITQDDELIGARCDLDAGKSYKKSTFNFAVHRQPDQYRMIVERKGAIDPA